MSFGNGRNRTVNPNQVQYAFKIKVKDLSAPQFEVRKREGEEWNLVKTSEPTRTVTGNVVAVEAKEGEYQGQKILSTSVVMEDGDDLYFVTIPMNNVGRAIINKLLTLTTHDQLQNVSISVYQSKPKTEGAKTYAQGTVQVNNEKVEWKFDNEDLPEIKKVPFKGQLISDTTDIDNFFFGEIKAYSEIVKKLRNNTPRSNPAPQSTPKTDTPTPPSAAKPEDKPADKPAASKGRGKKSTPTPPPATDENEGGEQDEESGDQVPF
jgi:hypothetical protein